MKTTVIFKDAKSNKVVFNAEITERNGYPEFTASGEYCGSMGQCFDNVEPATESQAKLIELWHKWHLNGMNAGTDRQMAVTKGLNYDEALKALTAIDRETGGQSFFDYTRLMAEISKYENEIKIIDEWFKKASLSDDDIKTGEYYDKQRALYFRELSDAKNALNSTLLYDVDPRDGESLYKYGSAWLVKALPEDLGDTLTDLIETIEQEEEEKAERPITAEDIDLFDNFSEPVTALALALICGLSVNEIDDISEDGNNYWTVQGVSYLAGTDDEMDVLWDEELDSYIDECIEIPAHIEPYFDRERWKDDAKFDGRGLSLNRYDGGEDYVEVNGTTYYAYRQ